MGWGNKRQWGLAVVLACGVLTGAAIAPAMAAGSDNTKSQGEERGVRFSIDREEYDAQARAALAEAGAEPLLQELPPAAELDGSAMIEVIESTEVSEQFST